MAKIRGVKPDYWTDEDVVELSIAARLLFVGMWNYACDNGHMQDKPKQIKMRILPADDVNASELIREISDLGLISREGGWITITNLRRHQKVDRRYFTTCGHPGCEPPQETVSQRESRRVPAVQTAGTRGGHDVSTASARVDGDGDGDGELMVKGTDPSSSADAADATTSTALAIVDRPDVDRLCQHLADRIASNGSKRPTIGKGWRDAARLLLDVDNREEAQVHVAIDWCQEDEFWRSNVLSMPKLREKYDQLRLAAQRERERMARSGDAVDWDAAMERARVRDERSIE